VRQIRGIRLLKYRGSFHHLRTIGESQRTPFEVACAVGRRMGATKWLILFLTIAASPLPLAALNPARHITQYAHTAWRMQDGAFNSTPSTIVQTPDGYMWVGTSDGILQFDGVHFVRWKPDGVQQLPSSQVLSLKRTDDGSMWITAAGFLSRWKGNTLTNYSTGLSGAGAGGLAGGKDGTVWVGQPYGRLGNGPLCQVKESGLQCLGPADGIPSFDADDTLVDQDGTLWVGGDTMLLRWAHGVPTVYRLPGLEQNVGMLGAEALAPFPGGVWVGVAKAGPGLGLQRLIDGRWQSFDTATFHSSSLAVTSLYTDREGALWVGTYEHGVYRIFGGTVDHFDRTSGLSGDGIEDITEDREGNLWVVTTQGVDRFADMPVISVSATEGLCLAEVDSVVASRDGSIWTGGDGALTRLQGNEVTCFRKGRELPGSQVTSLFEDHAGRLWVGLDQGLWLYASGRFQQVTRPDARPIGLVTGITEDVEQHIWIAAAGPPRILMRVEGLTVRQDVLDPPNPRRVAADPAGGLWLGLLNGVLAHVRDGHSDTYAFEHPEGARINQLLTDTDGSVFAATTYGLIGLRNGKKLALTQKNGLPCEQVYAIAFDSRGDLWLYMNCALGMLTHADLQTWKQNPTVAVAMRTFDALDGVRPSLAPFVAGARSSDGRLWFANSFALQVVHPDHLGDNTVSPPVHIEQIVADRTTYPAQGALRLPPLTRDLEIDYVGLSFVVPSKVLFRYMLEGYDTQWQESGTKRAAFYNDLKPGKYTFRVIASNNSVLWNTEGASLQFSIAPAWYQTIWFRVLCGVSAVALLWALYILRLRQMQQEFGIALEARVNERTRIARELHDTLLQSLHGLMFKFQAARNMLPRRTEDAMQTLDKAISETEQAITESRDAIHDLRSQPVSEVGLAPLLEAAAEELAVAPDTSQTSPGFRVITEGEPQKLSPELQDEVYRIASELLRNAFRHAGASQIEAEIRYDKSQLRLRIRDDGKGIDPKVLEENRRPGHWGLPGVQERAQRIGAQLSFWSQNGAGTEVELTIPAAIAYEGTENGHWLKFGRKERKS
jgi:signal transduction histidine kinase/ligand-binding sensor domain-containing protein